MTFREKNAWIAVVTTLVIWTYYFWTVWTMVGSGTLDGSALFWLFVWCAGLSVLIMLPVNVIVAVASRQNMDAPADERERLIDARANRAGLWLVEISAMALIASSGFISDYARAEFAADPAGATTIILINLLLFILAGSALVREVIQIVHFRMMD